MHKVHGVLQVRVFIGDREIERRVFDSTAITIGRAPGNDIRLDNPAVSSLHARIVRRPAGYVLEDLQSTNGTYLNGRRVTSEVIVGSPRVAIGKHVLLLYEEGESAGDGSASASSPLAGAEATMFAIRMARVFTGRDKVLKFEGGWHGLHDYAMVGNWRTGEAP